MSPWVRTIGALEDLGRELCACSAIALDSESDSLYHYTEKVCLVQVASDRGHRALVDTLILRDLSPLARALADPTIVKVFHGADYDVTTMKRDFGVTFASVFDTMIAARLLGRTEVGLQAMVRSELGIELSKTSQTDDWSRRPLTEVQERYALADVDHLLALRERLLGALDTLGRRSWVEEECAAVAALEAARRGRDPEAWQKIKGARKLEPEALAVMRELYLWRESRAHELDRPPFKVLTNETILDLSVAAPRSSQEVAATRGIGPSLKPRAAELAATIAAALARPKAEWPRMPPIVRPNVLEAVRRRVDRLKAWRTSAAASLGLDISVVLPGRLVDKVAEAHPRTVADLDGVEGLRRWRIETFGAAMVNAVGR